MIYGSVCSGIEAATVAWHSLGWAPAWFAEIEPFPSAVLRHHYPEIPNHGDFTKLTTSNCAPIDLLVGGTPCQSFSVAGHRAGLDDPRGVLAFEFLALCARLRPRWFVFENVPGLLSSSQGEDFAAWLREAAQLGYGVCWRVLDAQHFGVPQRRRRVFVVGCLGDWRSAGEVLFEPESLRGDTAARGEKGEEVAALSTNGVGTCGAFDNQAQGGHLIAFGGNNTAGPIDKATACNAKGGSGRMDFETETFVCTGRGWYNRDNVAGTLRKGDDRGGGQAREDSGLVVTHSLRGEGFDASEDGTGRRTPLVPVAFNLRGREGGSQPEAADKASIRAASGGSSRSYVFQERTRSGGRNLEYQEDVSYALLNPGSGGRAQERNIVTPQMGVRRLTPIECARLQGFPDTYCHIPSKSKRKISPDEARYLLSHGIECHQKQGKWYTQVAADGPIYKALGNSFAVPVVRWIGRRIAAIEGKH